MVDPSAVHIPFPYDAPASAALMDRASTVIPGGVNSRYGLIELSAARHVSSRARGDHGSPMPTGDAMSTWSAAGDR